MLALHLQRLLSLPIHAALCVPILDSDDTTLFGSFWRAHRTTEQAPDLAAQRSAFIGPVSAAHLPAERSALKCSHESTEYSAQLCALYAAQRSTEFAAICVSVRTAINATVQSAHQSNIAAH